jgi:hypothetical protein
VIGLPRVTPWRWLLPPARGLTPAGVVVVVARLRSRATPSRSAVSLAPALAHALLPDGRRRVLLIQLDPAPLRVKKHLMNTRIITALEYCRDPDDVGHRSPEALLAHGGELRVKLAMHRSPALVDPPPPDCVGSIPGPPCLTISVVLVAEPPKLFRLKCASYRCIANTNSTHFKRNNSLVCRVSARYNHGSAGSKQVYLARRRLYNHSTAHPLLIFRYANIITNLVQA